MAPRQSLQQSTVTANEPQVVETDWVPMPDGVKLAIRLWLPSGADADHKPVSAILDAVPYRRSDGTAIGDAAWGTYFASHGFAFARIDLRGSGDSPGIMADEYTPQEQQDTEHVIEWLATQPWSSGAVGMIGVSWGAFAALQLAFRHPPQLKGVVPIHGTDDRYADDVHYIGGCVSAMDMSQWATSMLAYLNQPPDPKVVGEGWREQWLHRLENAEHWIESWLGHQRRDDYWRQGSACEDYGSIRCPIFAIGGWGDGYRDMVLRVLEHVDTPVRGLIGPWGHKSPEDGKPGPSIGFLQEVVRFFDASLNGARNGFFDEPKLISYMQEAVAPAGHYETRPGRWVADASWPSPSVQEWTLNIAGEGLRDNQQTTRAARSVSSPQTTGLQSGVWDGDGSPADFPLDQRADDANSLSWETEPLPERVELLGIPVAEFELSVDQPWALVAVRVCDVAPDGASTLVARGLLNLARRDGRDKSIPMPAGEPVAVTVAMQSTAYAIPPGHRIRLAVSNAYWPWVWPSPKPTTLTIHSGTLTLPKRTPTAELKDPFGPPETGTPLATEVTMRKPTGRRLHRDLATGETVVDFDWHLERVRILATDTEMGEENVTTYRIVDGDPLSAMVNVRVETTLARPGWNTRVRATSELTCDAEKFTVTSKLDAFEDDVRVHARTWTHHFDRDGV